MRGEPSEELYVTGDWAASAARRRCPVHVAHSGSSPASPLRHQIFVQPRPGGGDEIKSSSDYPLRAEFLSPPSYILGLRPRIYSERVIKNSRNRGVLSSLSFFKGVWGNLSFSLFFRGDGKVENQPRAGRISRRLR